jgi:predicted small metal-binding protein
MSRWHIDCRSYPSENNCTVAISANSENELIDAAVQHAVNVHKHEDTPEFRAQLREILKTGEIPA